MSEQPAREAYVWLQCPGCLWFDWFRVEDIGIVCVNCLCHTMKVRGQREFYLTPEQAKTMTHTVIPRLRGNNG